MSEKPSILIINGGSSSIKFPLYKVGNPLSHSMPEEVARLGHLTGALFARVTPHGEAVSPAAI
jgi:acetate kinase